MNDETVRSTNRSQFRLTYRVRPPAKCPVRGRDGTVSDLSVLSDDGNHRCEVLVQRDDGSVEVEQHTHLSGDDCPCGVVVENGILPNFQPAEAPDELMVSVWVNETADAQSVTESLETTAEAAELIDYESIEDTITDRTLRIDLGMLTAKRREALERAMLDGYYETPSEVTIEELADRIGISSSAFATRLRKAEREIFDQIRRSL